MWCHRHACQTPSQRRMRGCHLVGLGRRTRTATACSSRCSAAVRYRPASIGTAAPGCRPLAADCDTECCSACRWQRAAFSLLLGPCNGSILRQTGNGMLLGCRLCSHALHLSHTQGTIRLAGDMLLGCALCSSMYSATATQPAAVSRRRVCCTAQTKKPVHLPAQTLTTLLHTRMRC
jgi:hypothetical protein